MKKRFLSIALVASLILSAAGCGETGSSDEINLDNIDEKIENMSDDEIEQAVLDGAEKLEEEYGSGSEITEAATTTAAPEPEEIVYEPTQEILDADFSSLKVQINNDVFQQGGYMTVAELAEQYGDRYEFTYMDGTYEERKDYLIEYKFGADMGMSKKEWFEFYSITMTPLYGNDKHEIYAYIANLTSPDEKVTLDKAYVMYFAEAYIKDGKTYTPVWTPKGFFADITETFNKKEDFPSENGNYKFSDFSAFLEAQGFTKSDNAGISERDMKDGNGDMKYTLSKNSYDVYFVGKENDLGFKPLVKCYFGFDSNTDKIKNVYYSLINFVK